MNLFEAALKRSYGTEIKPKQTLDASFCEEKAEKNKQIVSRETFEIKRGNDY